jgi:hypothetical protein
MRVYHCLNSKYGLQNIRRRRMKVATINELNDPFEFLAVAPKSRALRDAFAQVKAEFAKKNRGLLCFSSDWKNPVQWSHYADNHRGLCLGFDVTAELVPVTYTSRRLTPDLAALRVRAHMLKLLTSKFSHWRYEKEHRLFVDLDLKTKDKKTGLYFFLFCEEVALREVIIGVNSTITEAEVLKAIGAKGAGVKVYRAQMALRTFRMVRHKLTNSAHDNSRR